MTDIDATEVEAVEAVEVQNETDVSLDSSPDTELEAEQTEEPGEVAEDTEQPGVQKRIDELTKKVRDRERRAENIERERDYWRQLAAKQPEPEPVIPESKTLEDFDYDETAFRTYLFKEAENKAAEKAAQILQENEYQRTTAQIESAFREKEAGFAKTVEDYDDVARNDYLRITPTMAETIKSMDLGPEVLYYLGKNEDITDNIAGMSPKQADRELFRIEAKLERPQTEKVSKAPAPAPKLAAGDPAIAKDPDSMSQREWNEHRRKVIANRRR